MPTRDEYAATIKTGAVSLGTGMAMTALVAKFPILSNPILNKISEWVVEEILDTLVLKTEFGLFFHYIDLRVSQQGRDLYDAIQARKSLPPNASDADRRAAEERQIRSFAAFASFVS